MAKQITNYENNQRVKGMHDGMVNAICFCDWHMIQMIAQKNPMHFGLWVSKQHILEIPVSGKSSKTAQNNFLSDNKRLRPTQAKILF